MQLFGIDFTSDPRRAKPIVCAAGTLQNRQLVFTQLMRWESFAPFEDFLQQAGPWVAAIDFPFGQPRRLVQALGWPKDWRQYVTRVARLTKQEFCDLLLAYCEGQPAGDKHHLRRTDALAKACSPMMLYGVPVGKMLYEGAPRLSRSGASIPPCRPTESDRIVIEGYPALVARFLSDTGAKKPARYKNEKADSEERRSVRIALLEQCQSAAGLDAYGVDLRIDAGLDHHLVDDATGDSLDALFGLIQAAAFWQDRTLIPPDADPNEGWIADPIL